VFEVVPSQRNDTTVLKHLWADGITSELAKLLASHKTKTHTHISSISLDNILQSKK